MVVHCATCLSSVREDTLFSECQKTTHSSHSSNSIFQRTFWKEHQNFIFPLYLNIKLRNFQFSHLTLALPLKNIWKVIAMYGNWIRSKFSASLILKTIEETFSNYEGVAQMQNFGRISSFGKVLFLLRSWMSFKKSLLLGNKHASTTHLVLDFYSTYLQILCVTP